MQQRSWEYLVWAAFLGVCLLVGIALGGWLMPEPVVGVVRFESTIDLAAAADLVDVLESARQDERVAAVVVEVSSPGGLATSSESIFYTMLRLRAEKPVIVSVDGIALSGGYYMAAAANRIYAPASSYVGNVGTRGLRPGDPTMAPGEMSSGPYKLSGGSRFDRIHQLDLVRAAFLNNVVHLRQNAESNPLKADSATVGEGRIYLGSEGIAIGLVDFEGGRSDAILGAAELAGLHRYAVTNLLDYFQIETTIPPLDYRAAIKSMVETAPPDAVFLLDSRMPLPGLVDNSEVEQHLLRLRAIMPASLDAVPQDSNLSKPDNMNLPES